MSFPPKTWTDIRDYPIDDVVEGYRDHTLDDDMPGSNRSDGYRWGWMNARKDKSHQNDGFEPLRYEYIRKMRDIN